MQRERALFIAPILAGLAATQPAPADVIAPDGRVIECYCTDSQGARVELGETICLRVDGRAFLAQCQMSLNNPMWREISDSCLSSALPPSEPPRASERAG